MNPARNIPVQRPDERDDRRTVIPAPRSNPIFPGWGVRF
jgi:hypothetical protein